MTRMRIGIVGGTFDPPHLGHLEVVRHVRDALSLDQVLVIPAGEPWHKTDVVATSRQRLTMTQEAFRDEPGVQVSDIDVVRSGPTYTVDTLRTLHAQQPDATWFLILGQDAAAGLPTWREPDAVRELARLVIVTRPDAGQHPVPENADVVAMEPVEISSTQIRMRCAHGESIDALVAPAVARYIREHGLYIRG